MTSHSYSGLDDHQRAHARELVAQGCHLMLVHAAQVHYTQDARRWEGISHNLLIHRGQYPAHSDCSSSSTWLLWNALHVPYGLGDIVNGAHWQAGFTGTIAQHGKLIRHDANIKVGDLVLYGPPPTFEHVAVALGGGIVFSHGSEAGPFRLGIDYRPDRAEVRRMI